MKQSATSAVGDGGAVERAADPLHRGWVHPESGSRLADTHAVRQSVTDAFFELRFDRRAAEAFAFISGPRKPGTYRSWIIDGGRRDKSLFQMIRRTHEASPQGVLVAYKDNSAVIQGPVVNRLLPDPAGGYHKVEEAAHILQVREVLEGLAAARAAEMATPDQLAELRAISTAMEATLAADDLLGHLPLVARFHQVIIEAAGNEFIEQFLSMLRAPLVRHQFRIILVPGRKEESLAEHRAILAALRARDAALTVQRMREHFASGLEAAT